MPRLTSLTIACLACFAFSSTAAADWVLDAEHSHLSFGSVKKGSVGEVHHFADLDGGVTDDGGFRLTIALDSLETWIDIRNARMLDLLFEATEFPTATLTGVLDIAALGDLAVGEQTVVGLEALLSLHGADVSIEQDVVVFRLTDHRMLVVPFELIMLDPAEFGLITGIDALREVAGLPSIAAVVPVSFHLVFDR